MKTRTAHIVNGTACDIVGPSEASVVVLIHGLGLNRQTWESHLPALATQYRVLTYDLAGHGESAPPSEKPSLSLFSSQLHDLLNSLEINRCSIIGFSLGGMINRRFSLDYSDRVNALAILNSPHERSVEAQQLVEARAADTAQGGPATNLDATLARWFTREFRQSHLQIVGRVRRWVTSNEPLVYAQCRQVLASGVKELIRPQPPINVPTLVITAENDTGSTPAMAHAIAAEIPGAKSVIIPYLQHMGLLENPSAFTKPLLQFLERTL